MVLLEDKGCVSQACYKCLLIVVHVTLLFRVGWSLEEREKVIPLSVGLQSLELAGLHLVTTCCRDNLCYIQGNRKVG